VDEAITALASRRVLTDEQEQAVARRAEPLLLAAGAGTGKTSVLVERFVRAVREDGVAPGRILAITFTDRAAGELRERVRERFVGLGEREAARDTEGAFVSTFHGFCARLLRTHALAAGLEPEFEILDEGLAGRLRERACAVALRAFVEGERAEAVDLLAAYGPDRVCVIVEDVYAELRSRGERLPALPRPVLAPDGDGDDLAGARACALLDELLLEFGRAYDEQKRARGAVDFDDLELCAAQLLRERADVRSAWSERFELLMVDEFQDTSPRQLAILTALQRENLFTVGDELQSIYAFRHAQVSLFRARRAELEERGASLRLAHSFRSRAPILDVVNAVFAQRFAPDYMSLIAAREDAEEIGGEPRVELLLTSRRGWDEEGERPGASSAPLWRHAEADALAGRVADLVADGQVRAGEVAVLLRALGDLDVYERALQARGLRTLAAVGGFWERQEVGDLLAYLRVLANPLDEPALYGTLASPLVGCSNDALALLARAAGAAKRDLWATVDGVEEDPGGEAAEKNLGADDGKDPSGEAAEKNLGADEGEDRRVPPDMGEERSAALLARLPARDRAALVEFRARLVAERRSAPRRTISQLIERAAAAGDYRAHVLGLEWGERRLANIHKLLRLARRFEASEGRDLRGFLDHAARHRQRANGIAAVVAEPDAPVAGAEPDAVRLMSIHAAKGLEFPVVCVADLGRAPNLGVGDLLLDGERIGLRLARLDGTEAIPSLEFDELCQDRKRAQAEEEERILYVAMTRARERLILSAAVDFERWPEARQGAPPIAWLGPALAADLPVLVNEVAQPAHDLRVGPDGRAIVRCRLNTRASVDGAPPGSFSPEIGGGGAEKDVRLSEGSAHEHIRATTIAIGGEKEGQQPARSQQLSFLEPSSFPQSQSSRQVASPQPQPGVPLREVASPQPQPGVPLREVTSSPPPATPTPRAAPIESARMETLSYTALSELERCGYRYYLERVLGLAENHAAARSEPGSDGLEARARGTLVHKLLETVDFARPAALEPDDVARAARALGVRVRSRERAELATLVGAAAESALAERIAAADGVRREHPFAFTPTLAGLKNLSQNIRHARNAPDALTSSPLVTGVIDLLAHERDGTWLVVDYKSDRVGPEEDLSALVARDYGLQRLIYALAVLRDGARRVEVVHWFLQRPREWVAAQYTAEDRPRLQESLAEHVMRAYTSTFVVSERPHRSLCLTCPGRGSLCSWSDAETMAGE
jgi:ATP-dependent helicase/nuclease subunit A